MLFRRGQADMHEQQQHLGPIVHQKKNAKKQHHLKTSYQFLEDGGSDVGVEQPLPLVPSTKNSKGSSSPLLALSSLSFLASTSKQSTTPICTAFFFLFLMLKVLCRLGTVVWCSLQAGPFSWHQLNSTSIRGTLSTPPPLSFTMLSLAYWYFVAKEQEERGSMQAGGLLLQAAALNGPGRQSMPRPPHRFLSCHHPQRFFCVTNLDWTNCVLYVCLSPSFFFFSSLCHISFLHILFSFSPQLQVAVRW